MTRLSVIGIVCNIEQKDTQGRSPGLQRRGPYAPRSRNNSPTLLWPPLPRSPRGALPAARNTHRHDHEIFKGRLRAGCPPGDDLWYSTHVTPRTVVVGRGGGMWQCSHWIYRSHKVPLGIMRVAGMGGRSHPLAREEIEGRRSWAAIKNVALCAVVWQRWSNDPRNDSGLWVLSHAATALGTWLGALRGSLLPPVVPTGSCCEYVGRAVDVAFCCCMECSFHPERKRCVWTLVSRLPSGRVFRPAAATLPDWMGAQLSPHLPLLLRSGRLPRGMGGVPGREFHHAVESSTLETGLRGAGLRRSLYVVMLSADDPRRTGGLTGGRRRTLCGYQPFPRSRAAPCPCRLLDTKRRLPI